jgi:4-alpha-glucanotransferase
MATQTKRLIGTVVPVGALRTDKSVGVGEFLDLIELGDLCVKMGIGLIQILPVNETGYDSSPYSALTVFALSPLYLRIGEIPEAAGFEAKIQALGVQFESKPRFLYQQVLHAKMEILREIFMAHKEEIIGATHFGGTLAQWIDANSWVKEYAVYRRLKELNEEKSWKEWSSYVKVTPVEIEALWNDASLYSEHLFWVWVQAALDEQFTRAAHALKEKGILLEGDLPILVNEDSCDAWAHPEYFHQELSAGSPPDMYSPDGQNWGFPIYNWETLAATGYKWWYDRLKVAERYYGAYRIDHVLGFFRIWASRRNDISASLGRFVEAKPLTQQDLESLHFDTGRIRWLSLPHIPTGEVWDALAEADDRAVEVGRVFDVALSRIGNEELWLFKDFIHGEKDIVALGLHPDATTYLLKAWADRSFLEYAPGVFSPVWKYRDSRSYKSLSDTERNEIEALIDKRQQESEKMWEAQGQKLLSMLCKASSMLPCAEDLGAVPDCVPKVLTKLKILGLRVVRWFREWDKEGQAYVPMSNYPVLTVATSSVHDSSTLREWWDTEADQEVFSGFIGVPSLPKVYNPGTAKVVLHQIASAASQLRVFPIHDLLHLSNQWYAPDPASERVNVPGSVNEFNWTYRLPAQIAKIGHDEELIKAVNELANIKQAQKKRGV